MKLCVFGGTGATGGHIINIAKSQGYDVVALARRPEVLKQSFPNIEVVQGDVFKPETIKAALVDSDAAISTIGPVGRSRQTDIFSVGVLNIANVMQDLGKRRLIVAVSLIGLDPQPDVPWHTKIFSRLILIPVLGYQYRDTEKMKEKILRLDNLDWTLAGLPMLTNDKPSGHFRSSIGRLHHPSRISRADLASYLVSIINEPATFKQWTEVSW